MGKRSRRRERAPGAAAPLPDAPTADYPGADGVRPDAALRAHAEDAHAVREGAARHASRRRTPGTGRSSSCSSGSPSRWTISGVTTEGQKDLLLRLRAATQDERAFVRGALREHCAEWFPDVEAP